MDGCRAQKSHFPISNAPLLFDRAKDKSKEAKATLSKLLYYPF